MSSWKKVSNLFWQSGDSHAAPTQGGDEISDAEFQELLSASPHAVPQAAEPDPVDVRGMVVNHDPGGAAIDFQAQYDQAGIPNTDEVEQLENFLSRLDQSLPHASKLAAAQAFLGAVGKSKDNVLEDASRKIRRVRGVLAGKEQETRGLLTSEQGEIDSLQQQIEQRRQRIESLNRELEAVRHACVVEESRLQAARVFFGSVDPPPRS
jgi:hypothetical protein